MAHGSRRHNACGTWMRFCWQIGGVMKFWCPRCRKEVFIRTWRKRLVFLG